MIIQALIIWLFLPKIYQVDQCELMMDNHFNKMKSLTDLKEGQTGFLEMEVFSKANPLKKTVKDVTLSSSLYVSKKGYVFNSTTISVFQDEKDAIMVVHPQKRIIIGPALEKNKEEQLANLTSLQELILSTKKEMNCSEVQLRNQEFTQTRLIPGDDIKDTYQMKEISFFFNSNNELKTVNVSFTNSNDFLFQRFDYKSMDLDVKNWKPKPAEEYVFDRNNKLLTEYQGYTIIDNRRDDK